MEHYGNSSAEVFARMIKTLLPPSDPPHKITTEDGNQKPIISNTPLLATQMLLNVSVEEHSSGLVLHSVVYPNRLGDLWTEDYMLIKTHSLPQLCIL